MARKTTKELRCERAREFAEKARERFRAFKYHYEVIASGENVNIYVDGDWKHDHGWVDHQMAVIGLRKSEEIVTQEDGSDWYASTHIYTPTAL